MYCKHCGAEIQDNVNFCSKCGTPVSDQSGQQNNPYQNSFQNSSWNDNSAKSKSFFNVPLNPNLPPLVKSFCEKTKTNAIIWIVIAVLQIIIGLFLNWFILIIGALNILSCVSDFTFIRAVNKKPVGIVKRTKPLVGPIITLAYNLIFGGIIGVVGSIYYLVAIRSFVIQNENEFLRIEQEYLATEG